MKQFEGQDILSFIKELPNDDACKAYLAKINWHIQAYFDKFCFIINRSQFKTSIFHKTIQRMVEAKPIYQNQLKYKLNV